MQIKDKIKIGVLLDVKPYAGGSFQYAQSILFALSSLPRNHFEITAFYIDDLWKEYLIEFNFVSQKIYDRRNLFDWAGILLYKGAMLFGLNIAKIRNIYTAVSKFSRQFERFDLDLMIFPTQGIGSAVTRFKSVAVIHDLMHRYEKYPEINSFFEFKRRECIFSATCKSANMIFVDSAVGKEHVLESYGRHYNSKICVMPFTVPDYLFTKESNEKIDDINLPEKYLFYPAQFWEHKNHKNLISAISVLKNKGLEVQFLFVGSEKNAYTQVLDLIKKNGLQNNIHIMGYVSNSIMRKLYENARGMIMPSFCGPTNIPPLEGMAMGCPVAVSRRYAMPWQVGDAGLTFNPDKIEEIAGVIEKLWTDDDLCKQLSIRGKKRVQYFSQNEFNLRFKNAILQALK